MRLTAGSGWLSCPPRRWTGSAGSTTSGRWTPAFLDLSIAIEQSRLDQTYNTPALATIVLFLHQLEWMLEGGGIDFAAGRSERSAADPLRMGRYH